MDQKKASTVCSNEIPSWYRGFSRALFSSQMNVMPCKTKRLSIVGILAERYIQRQYTKVGGNAASRRPMRRWEITQHGVVEHPTRVFYTIPYRLARQDSP